MASDADVPELLERFMDDSGETRRWVTVHEIRTYFNLDERVSSAISGFLQRNYSGTYLSFPYRVERIERVTLDVRPHPRIIKKYLIAQRPAAGLRKTPVLRSGRSGAAFNSVFTDYDAVEHFDQMLYQNRAQGERQG